MRKTFAILLLASSILAGTATANLGTKTGTDGILY